VKSLQPLFCPKLLQGLLEKKRRDVLSRRKTKKKGANPRFSGTTAIRPRPKSQRRSTRGGKLLFRRNPGEESLPTGCEARYRGPRPGEVQQQQPEKEEVYFPNEKPFRRKEAGNKEKAGREKHRERKNKKRKGGPSRVYCGGSNT